MSEVHGACSDQFAEVRSLLAGNLDAGADVGASVAVFIDGEAVVDIWGGHVDEARSRPWQRDTIVNMFSSTKTMTALCALVLADRGVIDLHAPVARYWPEFAAEGKERVEVRQLLGHTCGLPGWDGPMTIADVLDREKATTLLARQAPWWEPGTAAGYEAITYGPLLGEVVRRTTGMTLTRFFAGEIAGPLGADCHIGAPAEADARVSPMIAGTPPRPRDPAGSIPERVFFNPYVTPADASTTAWRRGELGGSNGHGNARSLARVQQVLACGGTVGGVRLLSEAGCARALEQVADGTDLVLGLPVRWGMGYGIGSPLVADLYGPRVEGRRLAFWGGSGGSWVLVDLDARMTIAYVMNRHVEGAFDRRSVDFVNAAYDSLALAA
ncbi:beta-lactamase family protein [Geodermatophilus sp. YIM 151500]|uniref:serine hydrolase domain-containing protein n=1 Tax=Geodermatophilus sp. YIM 151500 TaxID=2984531 RepID=UPI0021E418FF|nr:serine hydrolase domain-containing protein [Geodermatophilus sp. YIM 151500]MCV2491789.1 beta-lactamase family protein [Geodermatophilus sp. YIM 151500]